MKACKNCGGDHRSDNKICPKHGGTKDGVGGSVASKPRTATKRRRTAVRSRVVLASASNRAALDVARARVDEELVDARAEVRVLERIAARLAMAGA